VAFDAFKSLLQDENGKISGPRTVIAGFGAGFTESLLAVTPFESIKTQMLAFPMPAHHIGIFSGLVLPES
jgi:solute carrier family 25 citrate transporter 1